MSMTYTSWLTAPLVLNGDSFFSTMSQDQFFEFCQRNPDLRIERTAQGDLVIMTPTGGETGRRSGEVFGQLFVWSKSDGTGIAFDSSTGFCLPNGATLSPDASWVLRTRWDALSPEERKRFPPLAPDFVIELRSESERLSHLREKLRGYVDTGVRLGWLIDPLERRVEVYHPGQETQLLDVPATLAGDPELPGFTLDLSTIW